jgi:predicted Zn-dependent protease
MIADVKPQQQGQASTARTMTYLIEFGGNIYLILGASAPNDFNNYGQVFSQSMKSFQELRDAQKINKLADRVRIKTVRQAGTLQQALVSYRVPEKRLEEISILNGMNLTDRVAQGSLIKVIEQ